MDDRCIAIMQPYFFPYIGYFQLINLVDKFVIYDDVNYINKGWINRNKILVNGKANLFTIPLKESSQNKKINEIYIHDDNKWQKKLIRTIELNYKKAPFFPDVFPMIESAIKSDHKRISAFNFESLKLISSYLQIDTKFTQSSASYNNQNLKGQERILDICKKEGAQQYVNPLGGIDLYDREFFRSNGVTINFIKPVLKEYKQLSKTFVPWLSIIDVIMFNSKKDVSDALNHFALI